MMKIKSLFRRGGQSQTASSKGCNSGGALKEASSISSLDSKHKIAPIHSSNKVAKANSKEKLDKINNTQQQKNDKSSSRQQQNNEIRANHKITAPQPPMPPPSVNNVDVLKNNNRIDLKETIPAPPSSTTTTTAVNGDARNKNLNEPPVSLPPNSNSELNEGDIAMQDLASVQEQLEIMARENAAYQEEIRMLISEKKKLQNQIQLEQIQHAAEIEQLTEENSTLRNRLRDVAHSPLSDNEKQQLLMEPTQRQHNSAPASFATTCENEGSSSGGSQNVAIVEPPSSCPTPDWDKHSSSSMSEVSVACLQDRILQMEETHYSTNEELQATLQELADLQSQLAELQNENERLLDEKTVLLESLCRQTEKLEDSRATVDTLQELLVRGDGYEQKEGGTEREQKLVELLKAAQEEREALLLKQTEMTAELHDLRQSAALQMEERERLIDRVRLLESTVDSVHAERKLIDQELAQAKEQDSARRIEISRLTTLLENARAKIDELEKERDQGARSEMDALLDTARKEKDTLESHVATLQGQVSRGQCEKERLQEQLSLLQEECKVAKNNAKSVISDLEYQLSEVRRELTSLRAELQASKDTVLEAQSQAQRHLEDKRNLKAILAEVQRQLTEVQERLKDTEEQLTEEQRLRKEENNEWEQFQRDLLMTVRVANDFKTEAQAELEKLVHENKALRDKVRGLEAQLEKLKATKPQTPPLLRQSSVPVETQQSLLTSVQQEMAARRQKAAATRQDSRLSVKSLIESIENATKQVKAGPGGSRSSSTSSLNSSTSDIRSVTLTPTTAPTGNLTATSNSPADEIFVKSPLREQQQIVSSTNNNKTTTIKTNGKNLICDVNFGAKGDVGKSEDTIRESVALLSAKNIDFVRRNSYGDLSERKDPLYGLVKNGGSKRNALLKWCQQKTVGYRNIDITNFSSSWNDGLALCALLHTYLPDRVPYDTLVPTEKRRNFSLAFSAAESVGIPTTLNINDMCQLERPDWQQVMAYVTAIYKHFET